ncbi:MAG: hypothetical protein JWN98_269, partial [Abditibacteriota bacterium]|nr:hypothetical protein [Abditibacteriota bacterium]
MNQLLMGKTCAAMAMLSGAISLTVALAQSPKARPSLVPVPLKKATGVHSWSSLKTAVRKTQGQKTQGQKTPAKAVKAGGNSAPLEAEKLLFFENQVQPIL